MTRELLFDHGFVIVLINNYFQNGFLGLLDDFRDNGKDRFVAVTEVQSPQLFGVAELLNGRIMKLVGKPKIPKSDYTVTGSTF